MTKWSYKKNKDGFMGSENRILEKEDKPEEGKVYALTGARGTRCIANGNTWTESEVHEHAVTIDWGQEKQERKVYTFATAAELDAFMKGVDEADGWLEYEIYHHTSLGEEKK